MKIPLFLTVVLIVILPLAIGQCPLPTVADIERGLTDLLQNADAEGAPYNPTVSSHNYTCLAQGSTKDTYHRVSIIATFTPKMDNLNKHNTFSYSVQVVHGMQ